MAETTLNFGQGLVESEEESDLVVGMVPVLRNWVPEASGILRTRVGWLNTGETGAPSTRRNTGLGYSALHTNRFLAACQATVDTSVAIYSVERDDLDAGWTLRDTISVANGAGKHVDFDTGLGRCFYTSPSFSGLRSWDGAAASGAAIAASPAGSRAVAFHMHRIFAGDGTNLVYSDIDTGLTWPGGSIQIGKDDGEPIETMLEIGDELIVGKEHTLWDLSGQGVSTFAVHKIPGDAGCAPGKTLVNTPYGMVIIGRNAVWLWDLGGAPKLISRPIEASYGMTGRYMSGTYIDGRCYIVDEGADDYFVFSPETNSWWMEKVDGTSNSLTNVFALGDTLLAGTDASTVASLAMYRRHPVVRGTRTKDFDDLTQTFEVKTPEMWLAGENRKFLVKKVNLVYRQRGGYDFEAPLVVTAYRDGEVYRTKDIVPDNSPGTKRTLLDFGFDAWSTQFLITQTLKAEQSACFDIESIRIEYEPTGLR